MGKNNEPQVLKIEEVEKWCIDHDLLLMTKDGLLHSAQNLCKKYENIGLTISYEFTSIFLKIYGYWKINGILTGYNMAFSYPELIGNGIDLEQSIDIFKKNFMEYLNLKEENNG